MKTFKKHGYEVIPQNPISSLIEDPKTGALKSDILNEKIISCVIEFLLPNRAAGELMLMVGELAGEVESVFSVSVGLRADEQGEVHFEEIFGDDVFHFPNAKVNIGAAQNIGGGGA